MSDAPDSKVLYDPETDSFEDEAPNGELADSGHVDAPFVETEVQDDGSEDDQSGDR